MKEESIAFRVSREKLEAARVRLERAGLHIIGDSGERKQDGFRVAYQFREDSQTLTLTLRDKPFYIPTSAIRTRLCEKLATEGIFEV